MMTDKRTPEPWQRSGDFLIGPSPEGLVIAQFYLSYDTPMRQNIERAVACVNACAGIATEALEAGVIAEMVAALTKIAGPLPCVPEGQWRDDDGMPQSPEVWVMRTELHRKHCRSCVARAALAKLEGRNA